MVKLNVQICICILNALQSTTNTRLEKKIEAIKLDQMECDRNNTEYKKREALKERTEQTIQELMSSNESVAVDDSDDALSRTDSHTDSRTDLRVQEMQETMVLAGSLNSSKQSVSSETELEPWRSPFIGTPPTTPKSQSQKIHKLLYKSFNVPYKCNYCTSLLIGVHRQGITCADCAYTCHVHCSDKAPAVCPVPADQTKRPMGIDVNKGIGTAYEGYVKVPRLGGIKKGWARLFVVVCDFKLFLFDIPPEKGTPSPVVQQVLDMRDDEFCVNSVLQNDVIHANRKDIPCIFKVTTSELNPPGTKHSVLMLAENETERQRWVGALNEQQKLLRRIKLPKTVIFQPQEVYDNSLSLVKGTFSAATLESGRLLLGTEEGVYIADLAKDVLIRIGDKSEKTPVFQVEQVLEEQLIVLISGWQRHIKLLHSSALEGYEVDPLKIQETRACQMFCTNTGHRADMNTYLCVAMKRTIMAFELTKTRQKHRKIRDIPVTGQVQFLDLWGDKLCVGYQSSFMIYNLLKEEAPISLVNTEDSQLQFLVLSFVDSMLAVEVSEKEYLLAFSVCGIYVDSHGRKSRQSEIMWPAAPTSISYSAPYLICYTENSVFVYDVQTSEWVQTLCLKKTKPINRDGTLNLINNFDALHLIYFKNIKNDEDKLQIAELFKESSVNRKKRRFSFKTREDDRSGKGRSREISAPMSFSHIAHMDLDPKLPVALASDKKSRAISSPINLSHIAHVRPNQGMLELMDLNTARMSMAGSNSLPSGGPPKQSGRNLFNSKSMSEKKPSRGVRSQNGNAPRDRQVGGSLRLDPPESPDQNLVGEPSPTMFEGKTQSFEQEEMIDGVEKFRYENELHFDEINQNYFEEKTQSFEQEEMTDRIEKFRGEYEMPIDKMIQNYSEKDEGLLNLLEKIEGGNRKMGEGGGVRMEHNNTGSSLYGIGKHSEESHKICTLHSQASRIVHSSVLIEKGNPSPSKYALPLIEVREARNEQAKLRTFQLGAPPMNSTKAKTIMLVGAAGTGERNFVDGIINFMLGVQRNDPFRFTVNDAEEKIETEWITCYTLNSEKGSRLSYRLNIIDTLGFGDTRGVEIDQIFITQIRELFSEKEPKGFTFIDAVCFLITTPDARLTAFQNDIFQSVMSHFGRDIENNICRLVSSADGIYPPFLAAWEESGLPCGRSFTFINSGLFADNSESCSSFLTFWGMGLTSFRAFFDHLEQVESKSLQMTKDVLDMRSRLEANFTKLQQQLDVGLTKLKDMQQEMRIKDQYEVEQKLFQNFEYEVEEINKTMKDLPPGQSVTNCTNCHCTCHNNGTSVDTEQTARLSCMESNGYCKVCPGKCHWTKHSNTPYIFEIKTVKTKKINADKELNYKEATCKLLSTEQKVNKLGKDLNDLLDHMNDTTVDIKICNERLKDIELRPNSLSMTEHIDFVIENENLKRKLWYDMNLYWKRAQISADVEKFTKDARSTINDMQFRRPTCPIY